MHHDQQGSGTPYSTIWAIDPGDQGSSTCLAINALKTMASLTVILLAIQETWVQFSHLRNVFCPSGWYNGTRHDKKFA